MEKEGITRREVIAAAAVAGLAAVSAQSSAAQPAARGPTRVFVITDQSGKIIGTGPVDKISHKYGEQEGTIEVRPIPLEGQRVQEVELKEGFSHFKTAEQLHKALASMLRR